MFWSWNHDSAPPDRILRSPLHQGGVVSTDQTERWGSAAACARGSLREGLWLPVGRGVYAVSGRPPELGRSRLGGLSARWGRARGLGRSPRPACSACCETTRCRRRARARSAVVPGSTGPWRFLQETAQGARPATVGVAAASDGRGHRPRPVRPGTETERLGWVTTAVQRRLTTPRRLASAARGTTPAPAPAAPVELVADVAEGAESPLEIRYLRDVERAHGLPDGRRQASRTGLPYLTDVDYDPYAVLVELDGRKGHEGLGRFRDMNRDNLHVLAGRWTLRYGCVRTSSTSRAGWPGRSRTCWSDAGWTGFPSAAGAVPGSTSPTLTPVHRGRCTGRHLRAISLAAGARRGRGTSGARTGARRSRRGPRWRGRGRPGCTGDSLIDFAPNGPRSSAVSAK